MKPILNALAALALLTPGAFAAEPPKNIIMIIGDGMGPAYTSAYRYYMDNPATSQVESTVFDQLLVGMSSTYSSGTQEHHTKKTYVTDSAASATALSTGVKTYNQAVALDVNDKPLLTLMEYAKSIGKTTGLVVTSQINHATPASFVAHNTYRYNYDDIADSYFDNRVNGKFVADLMFGGGQKYFIREDRNIAAQFVKAGYQYYDRFDQLSKFDRLPALGLFASSGLGYTFDNPVKYRLLKMVKKATKLLGSPDKGYFLLVEGSMIDWCGHDNDIACAMHEVDGLAKTVEYLRDYVDKRDDTLLVMTADHETGGLSIGAQGVYQWKKDIIKQVKHSMTSIISFLLEGQDPAKLWQEQIGIEIDDAGLAQITTAQKAAIKAIDESPKEDAEKLKTARTNIRIKLITQVSDVLARLTLTGWTSINHTGADVQVFAHGKSKALFNGHQDNTDIAKKLFKLMGRE